MTKQIIKITVRFNDPSDGLILCDISSRDSSWHGLKELERAKLFERLQEFIKSEKSSSKRMFGELTQYDGSSYSRPLKPRTSEYARAQMSFSMPLTKDPTINISRDITVDALTKFFNNLGFDLVIMGRYPVQGINHETTMGDYARKVADSFENITYTELVQKIATKASIELGQRFPDIKTYLKLYPLGEYNNPGDMQRLRKHGDDNWQVIFKGKSAVKQAIMDAINRSEEFDENGNRQQCPITLESFEGHNQVILILSRHSADGTMQADFVHAKMHDGSKMVDIAGYLKQLKKNPINNDPIVAMEFGTLLDIKDRYRITRPLRPTM